MAPDARITYAKKKDKQATIKAQKDESVRGEGVYKSHTIAVGSGEPPNSVSNPMPPRNPKAKKAAKAAPAGMAVGRQIESFANVQGRSVSRPTAQALPGASKPAAPAAIASMPSAPVAPAAKIKPTAPVTGAARAPPAIPGKTAPPPPPPPPPPAAGPPKEMYKALYNFAGQEGEMNLVKGEEVEVKQKDDNGASRAQLYVIADVPGWWMVVKNGKEGWAPSN
jgi:myosin-1